MTRTTQTYALLAVSRAAYDEIRGKLEAAGYQHAITDGELNMHGLALMTTEPAPGQRVINILDVPPSDPEIDLIGQPEPHDFGADIDALLEVPARSYKAGEALKLLGDTYGYAKHLGHVLMVTYDEATSDIADNEFEHDEDRNEGPVEYRNLDESEWRDTVNAGVERVLKSGVLKRPLLNPFAGPEWEQVTDPERLAAMPTRAPSFGFSESMSWDKAGEVLKRKPEDYDLKIDREAGEITIGLKGGKP